MSITEPTIKLLWGRAASRCSNCKLQLTQDKAFSSEAFPLGEQAHIVGEKTTAARGQSILTEKERSSYFNLILLCPTCHTVVDKNMEDFPVEKLHMIKSEHEFWVQHTLADALSVDKSHQQIDGTVYQLLIDAAVHGCCLDSWESWVSEVITTEPRLETVMPHLVDEFRRAIFRAVWPNKLNELERALETLSLVLSDAVGTFCQHSKRHGDSYEVHRFYKDQLYSESEYQRRLREYEMWVKKCDSLFIQATKAANWLADVVRRDVNPSFFAAQGKFTIVYGDFYHGYQQLLPEYTAEEKEQLPLAYINSAR